MVFGLGPGEMLFIILVILVIFGPSQIPKLAKALGKSKREFEDAADEGYRKKPTKKKKRK